eukprot:CAMPEP_0197444022 /NCGR_PEP_ID=MMETSP1175-20131217/9616_1 /TAXON_ID=1003142 /ORGANISM="Triceratium dubium, Strain CCMP147" /LENGTH=54 /DNA_ID=CAMNT_0042974741 /DNA_START=1 /DNA_END=165 /DNA_ORIENTATION=-
MAVDTQDEGTIKELDDHGGKWIDVGTVVGWIDDEEPVDGDWMWQANLDSGKDED